MKLKNVKKNDKFLNILKNKYYYTLKGFYKIFSIDFLINYLKIKSSLINKINIFSIVFILIK